MKDVVTINCEYKNLEEDLKAIEYILNYIKEQKDNGSLRQYISCKTKYGPSQLYDEYCITILSESKKDGIISKEFIVNHRIYDRLWLTTLTYKNLNDIITFLEYEFSTISRLMKEYRIKFNTVECIDNIINILSDDPNEYTIRDGVWVKDNYIIRMAFYSLTSHSLKGGWYQYTIYLGQDLDFLEEVQNIFNKPFCIIDLIDRFKGLKNKV